MAEGTKKKKKSLSSLKKKYTREKRRLLRQTWEGVLKAVEENISVVEGVVAAGEDGGEGGGVSYWLGAAGQVRWWAGWEARRDLGALEGMRMMCVGKLRGLEEGGKGGRGRGVGARGGAVGVDEEEGTGGDGGGGNGELDGGGYGADQRSGDDDDDEEEDEDEDGEEEEEEEEEDDGAASVASAASSSTSSSSSDGSFDLQWGDTLQTWAHSLGHASLKSLKKTEDETLASRQDAPVVLEVMELAKGKGRRKEDGSSIQDGSTSGAVRVVLNTGARMKRDDRRSGEDESGNESKDENGNGNENGGSEDHNAAETTWYDDFIQFLAGCDRQDAWPEACEVCDGASVGLGPGQWDAHLASPEHARRLVRLAKAKTWQSVDAVAGITKKHNLSVEPKRYTGSQADVEAYVTHVITEDLNAKASAFLIKLIEWQARTKEMDPMNAKRKRRWVCGMREAAKAVRLGKVRGLIVAPNVQPLEVDRGQDQEHGGGHGQERGQGQGQGQGQGRAVRQYPVDGILRDAQEHDVPVVFALTRRKMGKLLGQKKSVSIFALLNVQGAERDFDDLLSSREAE